MGCRARPPLPPSTFNTYLCGVKRLVQEFKSRVAERLHGVPRRDHCIALGVNDVAELLHQLQAVALYDAFVDFKL